MVLYILFFRHSRIYIWRNSEDLVSVTVYNFAFILALPVGFFINGKLLKYFKITYLYLIGCVTMALGLYALIHFSRNTLGFYSLFGLIQGFGGALYWANRNFLTLQETKSDNRNYFVGINATIDTITSIIIPPLVGWIIVFGSEKSLYTHTQAYLGLGVAAVLFMTVAGGVVTNRKFHTPRPQNIFLGKTTPAWRGIRLMELGGGIGSGVSWILPTILIFTAFGNEQTFGIIAAAIAILTAISSYIYGRIARQRHRIPVLFFSLMLSILASLVLLTLPSPYNYLAFTTLLSLYWTFVWLAWDPLALDVINTEQRITRSSQYSFVFDRELFLNVGRSIGIVILLVFASKFSSSQILFVPAIVYTLHAIVVIIALNLVTNNHTTHRQGGVNK